MIELPTDSSDILTRTCGRNRPLDEGAMTAAKARQDTLTKPPGSLGILLAADLPVDLKTLPLAGLD
jgi:NaMN:DMB phosphoribosyltransferase